MLFDIQSVLQLKSDIKKSLKRLFMKAKTVLLDLKDFTLIIVSFVGGGQTGTFGNKFSVPLTG